MYVPDKAKLTMKVAKWTVGLSVIAAGHITDKLIGRIERWYTGYKHIRGGQFQMISMISNI